MMGKMKKNPDSSCEIKMNAEYKDYIMSVQSQERKRISWILHDTVLQDMAAFIRQIDLSSMMLENKKYDDAQKNLITTQNNIRKSINDLRNVVYNLNPVDISAENIQSLIYDMTLRRTENTNIDVKINVDKFTDEQNENIPWDVCYRIADEAVSNSVKHSGCSSLSVTIKNESASRCRIIVRDNGHGFDLNKEKSIKHFGLTFIRESSELTNSKLTINSSAEGTEINISMPLRKREKDV